VKNRSFKAMLTSLYQASFKSYTFTSYSNMVARLLGLDSNIKKI